MNTFGKTISEARKLLGLSQKELAARLRKEDGTAISPQYLNDIEHDRRNAPSDHLLEELSRELRLSKDFLSALAGALPKDILNTVGKAGPDAVERAFKAFRRELK
jgi:transcriptional regulator with XRE-family HTH domain